MHGKLLTSAAAFVLAAGLTGHLGRARAYSEGVLYSVRQTPVMVNGPAPSPRNQVGTAYDVAGDRLIVFGGNNWGALTNDVWVLVSASTGAPSWVRVDTHGIPPSEREAVAVGYDPASNRLIVHGGWPGLTDTWVLTNANGVGAPAEWIRLPDAPRRRSGGAGAYDAVTNRFIVFGGLDTIYYSPVELLNDTWVLVDANGIGNPHWEKLEIAGPLPAPRYYPGTWYDSSSNRLLIHGGAGPSGALGDLWVLKNANGAGGNPEWLELSPAGSPPIARLGAMVGYDAARKRAFVVAGCPSTGPLLADMWVLDDADGSRGTPRWSPTAAEGPDFGGNCVSGSGFVPTTGRMILALGALGSGYRDDVWHLDLSGGDSEPPVIQVPGNLSREAQSGQGALVSYDVSALDDVDGTVAVSCTPRSGTMFSLGVTIVTCTAIDSSQNLASRGFSVSVVDTTPPAIESVVASLTELWPPNQKMVPISLAVRASDLVDAAPACAIRTVRASETATDAWHIAGPLTVWLRAERGSQAGRVYTVAIGCRDVAENASFADVRILVPHDQRRR